MHTHAPIASAPMDSPSFVYAGVAFDISTSPDVRFELVPEHRGYRAPFQANPAALSVRLALAGAPELAHIAESEVHAEWSGSAGRVWTRGARADVRQLGPRSFAATGLVSPDANGCSSMCTALAGALVDRVGGVVLHASGIEIDGGVVLFIGPSGAGKTTAANHCQGAYAFARDRAAIYPTPAGWHVAPMTGGDEIHLPDSDDRLLPLLGVLRVMQESRVTIQSNSLARSVAILRESAQMTDLSPEGEAALLARLVAVAGEVNVGTAHTVLGEPLFQLLRAWTKGTQ